VSSKRPPVVIAWSAFTARSTALIEATLRRSASRAT
jgi:hypothetical protein